MKKILLAIFLFITTTTSFAIVDKTKITIQEAVSIASENNLDIIASRKNKKINEQHIKIANRLENPTIGTFYNLGKAGESEPQGIKASQLIELGKRGARKDLAKSNFELTERLVEYLEFDLRMDVREAYTNLLAKKSVLKTMKMEEKILQEILEQAKEKYKIGEVTEIDVLQAKLLINQIITEVKTAEFAVKTALYDFNKTINCPDGFYDTAEESFTEDYKPLLIPKPNTQMPDFESISTSAINNRYDIKIALQQIEVAEKDLLVILRKKVPDLEIGVGYLYSNKYQNDNNKYEQGAFLEANLVNIPLLYKYKPEIDAAKLKLEQAHINYASIENKALNDLRKAYEKFLIAQSNI